MSGWLTVRRGSAPLILCFPHTGTAIPPEIEEKLVSPWLARKDTDWWVDRLYDFAAALDATLIRTDISRAVIDVNRDPSGRSLYPGRATTALCPLTSFDGENLYRDGGEPTAEEIADRLKRFFDPYHHAIESEIQRLLGLHRRILLYDAHAIRSSIPRLFDGFLPHINIGTDNGRTAHPLLVEAVTSLCARSDFSFVVNGRFRGGWTTRHYDDPARGIFALQIELAMTGYLAEPAQIGPGNWPAPFEPSRAKPLRTLLAGILKTLLDTLRDLANEPLRQ